MPKQSQEEATFQIERRIADEIMETVNRLQLPLKLDFLTEGQGNCFPMSIMQQCQRPEISNYLRPSVKQIVNLRTGHVILRRKVKNFVMKSKTERVILFKKQFEETDGLVNKESWNQYWDRMATDKTWVDYWFIQATSWYLQLNIWIVATSSTDTNPYIQISGNFELGSISCDGPIITLGTKSNVHYQSLLPIEMFHLDFNQNQQEPVEQITETRRMFNEIENIGTKRQELFSDISSQPKKSGNDNILFEHSNATQNKKDTVISDRNRDTLSDQDSQEKSDDPFIYEENGYLLTFLKI